MKLLIDADACPVTDIAAAHCKNFAVECIILCDTAHEIYRDSVQTLVFDKGANSVDLALVNRVDSGDIVITQDYGLASMCLAKRARVLHQDGWEYTEHNIQALLFQRHAAQQHRASGKRVKGPAKRTDKQNEAFSNALWQLLQQSVHG